MRALTFAASFAAALATALPAWPCGAPFGDEFVVEPTQQIVVAYQGGIETYVFGPEFCGKSTDFGLILPVPSPLSASPALASASLMTELDTLSAPSIEEIEVCESEGVGCGMATKAGDGALGPERTNQGVDVIAAGRVGDFDWVQIQADQATAFTDWLDANGYPHQAAADQLFASYVAKGWYFVAFKITASPTAPPVGYELCGELGPISLSFPTTTPVVPARIAAAAESSYVVWDVYTLAADQLTASGAGGGGVGSELRYSGALTSALLANYPEIASLAAAGDRFTRLRLEFSPSALADDIELAVDPQPHDFRATDYRYVERKCGGCSLRAGEHTRLPAGELLLWLGALFLGARAGRRRGSKR